MNKKMQAQIPIPSKLQRKGMPPKTEDASNTLSRPLDEELVA